MRDSTVAQVRCTLWRNTEIAPYGLQRLSHGLGYGGRALPPCKVSWQSEIRLRFASPAGRRTAVPAPREPGRAECRGGGDPGHDQGVAGRTPRRPSPLPG